jgi:hypothetical protein
VTTTTPLSDLDTLNEWVNDPANRAAWRETVATRQTEEIRLKEAAFEAAKPSRRVSPEDQAAAHRRHTDAEESLGLALLAEELAEHTRLRLAVILADHRKGADTDDEITREGHAWTIGTAVISIMHSLTQARHLDPGEVRRTARAVLEDVLEHRRSVAATLSTDDLAWWAAHLGRALRVIELAPAAD